MTILNPQLLWGMLGLSIPVLIHLWGRRRPRRTLFPSIQLIQESQARRSSLSRLRNILILLLRMLLIALVVLAFARPVVESRWLAGLVPGERSLVMVVDCSASMGAEDGDVTLIDKARDAAREVARLAPPGMRVLALAAGSELVEAPAELPLTQSRSDILALLDGADQAEVWSSRSTVCIITDLQETSLRGQLAEALPHPPIIVDMGADNPANRAITSLASLTPCPLRGRQTRLRAQVGVWGDKLAGEPFEITAEANGRAALGQTLTHFSTTEPASGELRHVPATGGESLWAVSIPSDGLSIDDTAYATIPVRDRLEVTIISGGSSSAPFSLALNPGGEEDANVEVRRHSWDDVSDGDLRADVIVVADLPADAPVPESGGEIDEHPVFKALTERVESGTGLLVFAGPMPHGVPARLREWTGGAVQFGGTVEAPGGEPLSLSGLDTIQGLLSYFANPRAGDLTAISFQRRRQLTLGEGAQRVASFSDGAPAIVACAAPLRRVFVLNTSIDATWWDAPQMPLFVPLVHQLCYYASGGVDEVWPDCIVGRTVRAILPEGVFGGATVALPGGAEEAVEADEGVWAFTPSVAGVYDVTWESDGEAMEESFAANVNPLESDPRRIATAELRRRLRAPDALIVRPDELAVKLPVALGTRCELTWPLLLLALLAAIVETLLSMPARAVGDQEAPV